MTRSLPSPNPRRLAVEILNRTVTHQHTLDYWLSWAEHRLNSLTERDRAFVYGLVYGTLRWQGRLDWIIDQLASRPAKTMDPPVRTIIRMGLFQLLFMDRVPDAAAVHTSVNLAKALKRPWATGFVNKVLRRAAAEATELPLPNVSEDPATALSVLHSMPQWLITRWIHHWGVSETEKMCAAINSIPTTTLRTNTLKTTRSELIAILKDHYGQIKPTQFSPEGVILPSRTGGLKRHPTFKQGLFQIQDEAAQLVAHLLSPQPGETVWDACAGLGTKTGHLAQLMKNRGYILASDLQSEKLQALTMEMMRLGIGIVHQSVMDLLTSEADRTLPQFDRILLDAPCSGSGVLRRNPDGKWSLAPDDLMRHHQRQLQLLERTAEHLKPGGFLVYSVCSMEPEENQSVIEDFLLKHREFDISRESIDRLPNIRALLTPDMCMRTLPHTHNTDGFFAACLKKKPR